VPRLAVLRNQLAPLLLGHGRKSLIVRNAFVARASGSVSTSSMTEDDRV
jgi:hypothetical protein